MVRKREVEGAVPYAKLYVCRGDHRSPDEKQIIDKRKARKSHPTDGYTAGAPQWEPYESLSLRRGVTK